MVACPGRASSVSQRSRRKDSANLIQSGVDLSRILIERAPVAIGIGRGTRLLYANPAAAGLVGAARVETAMQDGLLALFPPAEGETVGRRIRGRAYGEPLEPFETNAIRSDGTLAPVRVDPLRIELSDGPAVIAFITDLSERRAAEEALRSSEYRYRTLAEQATDAIFITDGHHRLVDVNPAGCAMLGYSRDELLALTIDDLVPQLATPEGREQLEVLRGDEGVLVEFWLPRKDGSRVPIELTARMLSDGQIHAIVRDISARKAAAAERDRLAAAVEQTSDSIVVTAVDGSILYVNPAFERTSGYTGRELLGTHAKLLWDEEAPEQQADAVRTIWAGANWKGTVRSRRKDGSFYTEEVVITPIHDEQGTAVGFMSAKRDVTRERALEAELRQAQKMEAIGRLAGGVAHDFNNLLTAISGYAELLAGRMAPGSTEASDVADIRKAAERAEGLTRQLLAFARKSVQQPQTLDLNDVVRDLAPMLRRLIGEDVELVVRAAPDLGPTVADRVQVEQVIMNLAVNARDAMPAGGRLTLETSNARLDAAFAACHPGVVAGAYASLAVSDTGCGMSSDVLDRVFEPFFTTKEQGKGTGLGLSMVVGIIEQSHGHVAATSEQGAGATFHIYLPRTDGAAEDAIRGDPEPVRGGGGETILVVEDEDAVRTLVCRVLEQHGYRVLAAHDPAEAIVLAADPRARIDLLLTDVVMPGLGGPELSDRIVRSRPTISVVFTSGYPQGATFGVGTPQSRRRYLAKPFTADGLLSTVRAALDTPAT